MAESRSKRHRPRGQAEKKRVKAVASKPDGRLTAHQEKFAQGLLAGQKQCDAYLDAYPTSKKWKKNRLYAESSKLAANQKVVRRLEELRKPVIDRAQMTMEGHLLELQRIKERAEKEGQFAVVGRMEELRGKVAGFYVERQMKVTNPLSVMSNKELRELREYLQTIRPPAIGSTPDPESSTH